MPAITNVNELQAMNNDLAGTYWLANDIDATATAGWNGGAGFLPIGNAGTKFTGSFNSLGHTISDLFINRPATDFIGLFGYTNGATITDCALTDVDITGDDWLGGLIGYANNTIINGSYVTGAIGVGVGSAYVGGFAGQMEGCTVTSCYSTATINGSTTSSYVGGFVGSEGQSTANTFTNCYATGNVTANTIIGGFVGQCYGRGTIYTSCYARGDVTSAGAAGNYMGGFAGGNSSLDDTAFSECYAIGDVSSTNGTWGIGGFAGDFNDIFTVSDCYARGDVTAVNGQAVGGFIGYCKESIITDAYSTGAVTGSLDVGGFCGDKATATITDCFWDTQTSGQAASDGGTGKTTAQMKTKATFTDVNWDFIVIWFINGITNDGYPFFFAMPPEPLPDSPRRTVAVEEKITLESIRNLEMAARGRFFIDKEGNAVYKSRFARNA